MTQTAAAAEPSSGPPDGCRLVFVTQLVDVSDPILGFVISWIKALSARCRELTVIANEVREVDSSIRAQVLSLGKEAGASRITRGLRYQRILTRLASDGKPQAILAHMCPIYLDLAAPLARAKGIKTILWYAHPAIGFDLRAAVVLADEILTSFPGAFPLKTSKVRAIGQGIDLKLFTYSDPPKTSGNFTLVAAGRTSPSKGYETIIRAVQKAKSGGSSMRLRIIGPSTTAEEKGHRRHLEDLVSALALERWVTIEDGRSQRGLAEVFRDCSCLVNNTVAGTGDKVVLEAMASGRPTLLSNPVLQPLIENLSIPLKFRSRDSSELAQRLLAMENATWDEQASLARTLRKRVESEHSVDHWADEILKRISE